MWSKVRQSKTDFMDPKSPVKPKALQLLNLKHAVSVRYSLPVRTSSQHRLSHHAHLQIADTRGSAFAFCPLMHERHGMRLRRSGGLADLRWRGWGQQQGFQRSPSSGEGRGRWETEGDKGEGGSGYLKINKNTS